MEVQCPPSEQIGFLFLLYPGIGKVFFYGGGVEGRPLRKNELYMKLFFPNKKVETAIKLEGSRGEVSIIL